MKLSILDHTQISEGRSVADALSESLQLAQEAERLGYRRFWMSEHHGSKALASSSPEVLAAHIAAGTSTIRVGTGGVMLPHYSAYKAAENFRLLEALHPGRIDMGLGRAPGGMPLASRALQEGKASSVHEYPRQVADLIGYLRDSLPEGHRFSGLTAAPIVPTVPEMWLLGSSGESARLAAELGVSFAFAEFFGSPGGEAAIRHYKERFRPSAIQQEPRSMIAVLAICADTREEAEHLASSQELFFLRLTRGQELPWIPSVETALSYPYTPFEQSELEEKRRHRNVGTPEEVKAKLEALSARYDADELMVVVPVHDFEARLRSIRLLAEVFGMG
ncbi:LLM class flavin-dependent oxidoreductase [Gorillibacterium sp. sgz5001074]|uniref:LLM class flavin-dependent oxidoreductase n=1 Tax=Gorillibacterium sp. sgz5001074 TaxID=3446695 RepID=UPI003F68169E